MATSDPDATTRVHSDLPVTPHPRSSQAQFAPGTIVAGRYRIAGILGSGGMGEVYRADDIKLDQAVALKFLPARLARDPVLLARLHDEVRLGRQIAHPNVCRIYDIVDSEGSHFVAMEFVDGEDLSRLLRRIGRLADDKAVDIARGIAAGLLAAHAKGILHRDLKPANVMIDSHGESRIMDFGLALAAGENDATIAGTPAYMAPEQLDGHPATIQSDLYSLGLVMYELFTGKRAHNARTLPERMRDLGSEITSPSSVIRDLDPAVERIILRCLATDPTQRPRSAREVIEALPGGDPLAAAIAAGETPSPRIVAAAGTEGVLSRRVAWSLLGATAALFALLLYARGERSLGRYGPPMLSPEILHDRATAILATFGVPAAGQPLRQVLSAAEYSLWIERHGRWESIRNGPQLMVYRLRYGVGRSEAELQPRLASGPSRTTAEVDGRGRLILLVSAPAGELAARQLDWDALLKAGGFEPRSLRSEPPRFAPPAPFDMLRTWSGTYPGDRTPVRIEAASWRGTPTFFRVTGPWDEVANPEEGVAFTGQSIAPIYSIVWPTVVGAGLLLAWRNLRLRRGDRQGALRIAVASFLFLLAAKLLIRIGGAGEAPSLFVQSAGEALYVAAMVYLFYIALEPFIRRRWPSLLIGWSRLVTGQVRNPMVGRDVTIGIITGLMNTIVASGTELITGPFLGTDQGPNVGRIALLEGIHRIVANVLFALTDGITMGLAATVLLVLLMMMLRKRALAAGAFFLLILAGFLFAIAGRWEIAPFGALLAAIMTSVAVRYGLLAFAVMHFTFDMLFQLPYISASWATPLLAFSYALTAILAVWAFRTALGGQSLIGEGVLGD